MDVNPSLILKSTSMQFNQWKVNLGRTEKDNS
jgi:hypothetical protein